MRTLFGVLLVLKLANVVSAVEKIDAKPAAKDAEQSDETEDQVLAGHSYHGEAFNKGPRQAAYLMEGTGNVTFPVKTENPLIQKYINQGVGQLHGFWFFEAERTFRQAAAIEPDCAAAYWGMAMANSNNRDRAKEFCAEAVKRKDKASERVQKYIAALDKLLKADNKKKEQASRTYIKDLEKIVYEYPEDIEAKAFIALHMWEGRRAGLKIISHLAVSALIGEILAENPMHPVHHYRIHLWDYEKPERALASAALCGQSAPTIAHMWHMPGHIYSRLKRYDDAVWQQEASARTDHTQMIRDRLLPDQIHNFSHNNEWLIRNLIFIGRINDAVDLAKNMTELPRHPEYNLVTKRSSSSFYGRQRLFQVLSQAELWDELIRLADTPYLQPTTDFNEQVKRERYLGRAYFLGGHLEKGKQQLDSLETLLAKVTDEGKKAIDEAVKKAEKENAENEKESSDDTEKSKEDGAKDTKVDSAEENNDDKSTTDAEGVAACDDEKQESPSVNTSEDSKTKDNSSEETESESSDSDPSENEQEGDQPDSEKNSEESKLTVKAKKAIEKARKSAKSKANRKTKRVKKAIDELKGHLALIDGDAKEALKLFKSAGEMDKMFTARVNIKAGKTDEALKIAKEYVDRHKNETIPLANLVDIAWELEKKDDAKEAFKKLKEISSQVDLSAPPFVRLSRIAVELGEPTNWRIAKDPADDIGIRPNLDTLGPFRWHPQPAPSWSLEDQSERVVLSSDYKGRPVVVIFYLGFGCLHCAEQLQAFAPHVGSFAAEGFDMVAISSDSHEKLMKSIVDFGSEFPIRLLSNDRLDVFKSFRVYDDFEKQPLHGTFIIDGNGLVRWHDISYEPFMDHEFVLEEAKRLLEQDKPAIRVANTHVSK